MLVDAGSLNGTYLNHAPSDTTPLHDGDEIWIGVFRLTRRCGMNPQSDQ